MCGIFAYLNYGVPRDRRYILEALYKGLRRLEYRGYDSAGLSIDSAGPHELAAFLPGLPTDHNDTQCLPIIFKAEGKIDALVEKVRLDFGGAAPRCCVVRSLAGRGCGHGTDPRTDQAPQCLRAARFGPSWGAA